MSEAGRGDRNPPGTAGTRRQAIVIGLLAAMAAVTCFGLGIWQLERRLWKLDLIERVEARSTAPPVAFPPPSAWTGPGLAGLEYRRVSASGRFRHDLETFVQAVTEYGPGFWVLTPFETEDGFTVLVNRGFVPPERREAAGRAAGNPNGIVHVTGLARLSEPGGAFLRRNDPAADRWYSRDVAAIAAARGLGRTAPYFVDADTTPNPGGWPVGGLTVLAFRNTHLVYALTWFALALMAAGALGYLLRQEAASRGGKSTSA